MFFGDPALDRDLPWVNQAFWSALIGHIESDGVAHPRSILDIGCHTGGLLAALHNKYQSADLIGIEPLLEARREAGRRLGSIPSRVHILGVDGWDVIDAESVDLVTCHEVLYLESSLERFMNRLRKVVAPRGTAYVVLGCHAENPLWTEWRKALVAAGNTVFDHAPLDIMAAASAAGFLPSVQPLRRSGWVTYDPLHADFRYPDVRTMFKHHYIHKLIFRFIVSDDATSPDSDRDTTLAQTCN